MDVGDSLDDCRVGTKLLMLPELNPILGFEVKVGIAWVNGELYGEGCIPDFLGSPSLINIWDCLTFSWALIK